MNFKLYSTSGKSVTSHHRAIGRFLVKAEQEHPFTLLEEAWEFFKTLEQEATLWDVTDIPELLESKQLMDLG